MPKLLLMCCEKLASAYSSAFTYALHMSFRFIQDTGSHGQRLGGRGTGWRLEPYVVWAIVRTLMLPDWYGACSMRAAVKKPITSSAYKNNRLWVYSVVNKAPASSPMGLSWPGRLSYSLPVRVSGCPPRTSKARSPLVEAAKQPVSTSVSTWMRRTPRKRRPSVNHCIGSGLKRS